MILIAWISCVPVLMKVSRSCLGLVSLRNFVASDGREFEPGPEEKRLGSHTVMAIGYDNATPQHFIIQNSWGEEWYDRRVFLYAI